MVKKVKHLIRSLTKKIKSLLKKEVNFRPEVIQTTENIKDTVDTTDTALLFSRSNIFYKFTCPGWSHSYIGIGRTEWNL